MYSIVLMMAMTSGTEAPDLGHRHGCTGGGCTGAVVAAPACGCTGGRHHRERRHHGCTGAVAPACGCTGYVAPACATCAAPVYSGCTGGYAAPVYGPGPGCVGSPIYSPVGPAHHDVKPGEEIKKMPKEEPKKTGAAPGAATLIVSLPADAMLSIDDTATSSTSEQRTFVSPTLNPGMDYNYTLKAEVVRNGKTVKVEEKVVVRAGEETRVTLTLPTLVAAR